MMDSIPNIGAAGLGCIIGWLVYYINRHRRADVQFSDLTTVIGIVGGAGMTSLLGGADKALFGSYGMGLFVGFFGYFLALVVLAKNARGAFGARMGIVENRQQSLQGAVSVTQRVNRRNES